MALAFTILIWLIAALGLGHAAWATLRLRRVAPLPQSASEPCGGVTVVMAARDEAPRISGPVVSFLAQEGVDLQVVVVDDRSTDGTADQVRAIACGDGRLEVVRVDSLPPDWLGKCHALHEGAQRGKHPWIVFADADTMLTARDALCRAASVAEAMQVDHVCLLPRMPARTLGAQALMSAFFVSAVTLMDRVNRDRPRGYFGVGAFNMVRADLYRAMGGHEPLRLEVVDDVHLGLLVRRHGGRSRILTAFDAVSTTWGATLGEFINAVEKNAFASAKFSTIGVCAVVPLLLLVWGVAVGGPVIAIAMESWTPLAAFVGLVANGFPAAIVACRLGFGAAPGFLAPFVLPVMAYASVRSMALALRRGGITWRDTHYSLKTLRAGRFR